MDKNRTLCIYFSEQTASRRFSWRERGWLASFPPRRGEELETSMSEQSPIQMDKTATLALPPGFHALDGAKKVNFWEEEG